MRDWLKMLIAGEELRALHRYRVACALAFRWNARVPNSAETAKWIQEVGDDKRGMDIERFRASLEATTPPEAPGHGE